MANENDDGTLSVICLGSLKIKIKKTIYGIYK